MGEKKKESEYILERKRWVLDAVDRSLKGLIDAAHDLQRRIESRGEDGYYGSNNDILRRAQQCHMYQKELQLLSDLLVYCEPDYGTIEQLGKDSCNGKEEEEITKDSEDP